MLVTASIVCYKNDRKIILDSILSFINSETTFPVFLFLIDNSPTDELKTLINHPNIEYISNPSNPGFGPAHNIAIKMAISAGSKYHFVLNPDVSFQNDIIAPMLKFMEENTKVGMLMPQILYEDGSIQNLPKLLPSPMDVLMRKIKAPKFYYKPFIDKYELRFVEKSRIYNAPILSGCFTMLRVAAIKEVGMYDDRFFMYFEDWDLSRRMYQKYQTVYFPLVSVVHGYESGANKNKRLFKIFIRSGIAYFNKWGWIFDKNRNEINKTTLSQFK
ncbi:hypothetical protein SAMN05421638_2147 [Kaistella treverensis]|uniref:Glycosyltransferase 2-like domain-containing protein n=1 Tax=Kaistella treverensis TaxID=631455 RepID=A0A1I3NKL4_9FLAO|nr:glycosyltransferase family 2 protein [Kaistella treverensis]SFJ09843.1 hypothetical protein SAMN05421638_2147 [Kaistella treverensis]